MSRVLFIDVLAEANADDCENLGQATIAAMLRKDGHRVTLASLSTTEVVEFDTSLAEGAGIVGFSIYNNTADTVFAIAARLRGAFPDLWLCAGGQLATAAAADILAACPALDACIRGNAEAAMTALAGGADPHSVPGVITRSAGSVAPPPRLTAAEAPWPARDLLPRSIRRGNPTARLNTTLGCVADCDFCSVNGFWREGERRLRLPRWTGRDARDIRDEISAIVATYGVRSFVFNDASFEDPGRIGRRRVVEICGHLRDLSYPVALRCAMRAETLARHGDDLLPAMRAAGVTNVFIGVEADSDTDLAAYSKLADAAQNRRAIAAAARHDVDVTIGFIMFHPRSTPETLQLNAAWLARYGADKASHYTRLVDVYAGTALEAALRSEGLLCAGYDFRSVDGYRFTDRAVAALSAGLEPLRLSPVLARIDGQMYHLGYTLSALRALYPEAAAKHADRFAALRRRYAEILAAGFGPVFAEMRPPGSDTVASILDAAGALRIELSRFGTRLMLSRDFAGFFRPRPTGDPSPRVRRSVLATGDG